MPILYCTYSRRDCCHLCASVDVSGCVGPALRESCLCDVDGLIGCNVTPCVPLRNPEPESRPESPTAGAAAKDRRHVDVDVSLYVARWYSVCVCACVGDNILFLACWR